MAVGDEGPAEATLQFHEQADGRKVARLGGGKVVLVHWDDVARVRDGEWWNVKLEHRETYSIAKPIERARPELLNPVIPASLAASLGKPDARVEMPAIETKAPSSRVPPVPAETGRPERKDAGTSDTRPLAILPSRVVGMNDRVAMFVDGANMDLAARMAGYFVDYRKARNFFLAHGLFYAAYYYIADYTASDPMQQRYLDFLAHSDFIVRRKAVKAIRDQETGERVLKANVDTELILDLINTADNYDLAFLFSGDSDFERAVDLLRSRGKRVYVVTSRQVISRELAYVADKPVFFLEEFRNQLERDARPDSVREP
ncbi:MAG TPA: NYN domain-containing protein [Vicinamibacterales bacterium]|jgi:uncharacterized LabA/DUF88 family protein|nr:NYN domain-containing protein [Vicinamibacterales bacterium]